MPSRHLPREVVHSRHGPWVSTFALSKRFCIDLGLAVAPEQELPHAEGAEGRGGKSFLSKKSSKNALRYSLRVTAFYLPARASVLQFPYFCTRTSMLEVLLESNGIVALGIPCAVDQRNMALFRSLD